MRLFLVRHGESQSNADWEGVKKPADLNSPLTELGENQSEKLAAWMKSKINKVDLVLASSLLRAGQTALPIAEANGLKIAQDHRLREGGYSYSDGSPIPDDLLPMNKRLDWHTHPHEPFDPSVEGCESYAELKFRVGAFLDEIVETQVGKTIVAVTHGWTMNAFFDVFFTTCVHRQCYIRIENTALSFIEYKPEWELGPWFAHFLLQTPHLEFYPKGID
jgi:broad specificity phosphatase PhoE